MSRHLHSVHRLFDKLIGHLILDPLCWVFLCLNLDPVIQRFTDLVALSLFLLPDLFLLLERPISTEQSDRTIEGVVEKLQQKTNILSALLNIRVFGRE